jgi:two-component system, cell cycle sensor histidine kinase and response regulator CckA
MLFSGRPDTGRQTRRDPLARHKAGRCRQQQDGHRSTDGRTRDAAKSGHSRRGMTSVNYTFDELFDLPEIHKLAKQFSDLVGICSAIIGVDGHIWVKCNWQDICEKFHRQHPRVRERCLRSDIVMPRRFADTQDGGVYRCKNGLYEAAAPIRIQGEHIANLYMGQFLQGPPDMTFFIKQARKYGFDEIAYLQALLQVPIFSKKKVTMVLGFFNRLAALIGEMGLRRIALMETNASLRDSEQRYRLVVENAGEGIMIVQGGQVRFANQKVIKNIGEEQEFLNLIHDKDRKKVSSFLRQVLGKETSSTLGCVQLQTASGKPRWVHLNATSVNWQSEPAQLLHLFDITAQKKAEQTIKKAQQELANAQKMEAIANLATGVAHDFNNFAQIIGMNVELLLAQEDCNSPRYRKLREIEMAVTRTSELTQRLMLFRHDQRGFRQTVDVNQLLGQVLPSLRALLPASVEIEFDLRTAWKVEKGDPVQLFQIFMNLILNASDSMPQGGKILIRTDDFVPSAEHLTLHPDLRAGRYIRIRCVDEGRGLTDEDMVHLFEPFYTSKTPGQGHGLGLTAVYHFVKNHEGYITCGNANGKGACFDISLPAVPEMKPVIQLPIGGYETILLVDDDAYILHGGKEYLHSYGYTVLEAMSGEEACEVYRGHDQAIALVIMDLVMPGMGGEKCIETLLDMNPDLNILVASAYLTDAFIRNSRIRNSIKGFIAKPYIKGRLLHAIRRAMA